jgi:hypothetical protein
MQIIMTGKEMDEAISVWLASNGFTAQKYDITTKVVVGRGEGAAGTRVECQLEPKPTVGLPDVAYSKVMAASVVLPEDFDEQHIEDMIEAHLASGLPSLSDEPVKVRSPFARD